MNAFHSYNSRPKNLCSFPHERNCKPTVCFNNGLLPPCRREIMLCGKHIVFASYSNRNRLYISTTLALKYGSLKLKEKGEQAVKWKQNRKHIADDCYSYCGSIWLPVSNYKWPSVYVWCVTKHNILSKVLVESKSNEWHTNTMSRGSIQMGILSVWSLHSSFSQPTMRFSHHNNQPPTISPFSRFSTHPFLSAFQSVDATTMQRLYHCHYYHESWCSFVESFKFLLPSLSMMVQHSLKWPICFVRDSQHCLLEFSNNDPQFVASEIASTLRAHFPVVWWIAPTISHLHNEK